MNFLVAGEPLLRVDLDPLSRFPHALSVGFNNCDQLGMVKGGTLSVLLYTCGRFHIYLLSK
jgi:hypothetical protein